MTKLLIYDLETTGLLPNIHGICQFAAKVVIDGEEVKLTYAIYKSILDIFN